MEGTSLLGGEGKVSATKAGSKSRRLAVGISLVGREQQSKHRKWGGAPKPPHPSR